MKTNLPHLSVPRKPAPYIKDEVVAEAYWREVARMVHTIDATLRERDRLAKSLKWSETKAAKKLETLCAIVGANADANGSEVR